MVIWHGLCDILGLTQAYSHDTIGYLYAEVSMAERRMFAKTIVGSDAFLDMPQSTQALYFHLAIRADDDGFVNSPKSIMRVVGCKDDDISILAAKKFIIPFESGVIVIKHWRIHNYIAKDRYTETKYKDEMASLLIDKNGSYTKCIQLVDGCETQVRLGKDSIGKDSIKKSGKNRMALPHYGECEPVYISNDEMEKLLAKYGKIYVDMFIKKISLWEPKDGKRPKNDYMTILRWMDKDKIPTLPPPAPKCEYCGTTLQPDGCCHNKDCPQYA